MSHPDDDLLAGHALGDVLPPADADHVAGCETCSARLASLRAVTADLHGPSFLVQPPAAVWNAIEAQIADGGSLLEPPGHVWQGIEAGMHDPARAGSESGRDGSGRDGSDRPVTDRPAGGPDADSSGPGRRARRRSGWPMRIAAGFIGLIVGAAAVFTWQAVSPRTEQVAFTTLNPLPDRQGSGTATLDRTRGGNDVLRVDVSSLQPDNDGFFEVWLLAPDAKKMVTLGNMRGDRTTFNVPAGLDVAAYPIVDISAEPLDGNPSHSGDSIVRGKLDVS